MGAKKLESQNGRERLIATALKLFAERGFDGVTVRDIAKASGVSVGLINHHFDSKEGLRDAVDQHFIAQFEEAITDSFATQARTAEEMSAWVDTWISRHQGDWPTTVAYFRRALLEGNDWGASLFARFYRIVQTTVMRMDASGNIRPNVDRLWLPFLIMFLELGTTLLDPFIERIIGKSGFDPELWRRRHRAYMSLIMRGIAPAKVDEP